MKRYIRSSKSYKYTVERYIKHGEDPIRDRFDSYREAAKFASRAADSEKYEDVIITSPGVNGPTTVNTWSKQDGWYTDLDPKDLEPKEVKASVYVQRLIRKRPKKDRNGEPLVYSGSGGRSLVGVHYKSIDKFESKEAAIENLKKYAKNPDEWEIVELEDVDNIEASVDPKTIQSSIDVDNLNKGDIIVVNNESKLSNKLDLVAVTFDHYSKDDDRTFWGWAWNEHLFRYYKSTIVYHAKSMDDAEKFISKNKKKSVEDFKNLTSSEDVLGWYVGDPDPTGRLEGDLRFENSIHSWRDAYQEFNEIADKYFPDAEKIEEEVAKLYFRFKHNPFFQKAWDRWCDSGEDAHESIESAVRTKFQPFVITYSWDEGTPEDGPIIRGGEDLVWAETKEEAERLWAEDNAEAVDAYSARPATPDEVNRLEKEMKEFEKMIASSEDLDDFDDFGNEEDQLYLFLEDCAQETGAFDYTAFFGIEMTDEIFNKLTKYMNRYMAAADDNDEYRCDKIGEEVAKYLEEIK